LGQIKKDEEEKKKKGGRRGDIPTLGEDVKTTVGNFLGGGGGEGARATMNVNDTAGVSRAVRRVSLQGDGGHGDPCLGDKGGSFSHGINQIYSGNAGRLAMVEGGSRRV